MNILFILYSPIMSTKFYFNEQSSVLSVTQYQIDIFIQIIIQNYEMVIFTSLSCEGLEDINLITKIIIYEHQLYVYLMSGTIRIKNTNIYKLTHTKIKFKRNIRWISTAVPPFE